MFFTHEFQDVWEYWLSICGNNIIPNKKDFDPAALSAQLGEIGIFDWEGDELYLRVLGSDIIEEIGVDFSGHKLLSKGLPSVTGFAKAYFRTIFNFPCGLQTISVERKRSGLLVEAALLFLPLDVEGRNDNQILVYRQHLASAGYDSKYPDFVHLGINQIIMIDLGCGTPDIDLEKQLEKTRFLSDEKKGLFHKLLLR
ncbi:PAS domain-containing protein [Emcibacter sp.]|uniref:PAS domain-containing protein n=1 Tax=Emcibacter sp. TaxID=1979954 RepID=UPI003A9378A7